MGIATSGPSNVFSPVNELEQAMLRAASDSSAAPEFYRLLLESELIVLGTNGERLALDAVKHDTGFFHPVFTSKERLTAYSAGELPRFRIPGRALFEVTRGAQFLLNPRSPLSKTLLPDEIAWFLDNFRAFSLAALDPGSYPTKLIKALCVLFTSRSQLQSARLAFLATNGGDTPPHLVIGIEADGDIPRLANEIFAAAAVGNPGHSLDVVALNTKGELHPIQKHLLTVRPFFERQATAA